MLEQHCQIFTEGHSTISITRCWVFTPDEPAGEVQWGEIDTTTPPDFSPSYSVTSFSRHGEEQVAMYVLYFKDDTNRRQDTIVTIRYLLIHYWILL